MHIYDFLTDKTQYELKQEASSSGSTRFEEVLKAYKARLLKAFEQNPFHDDTLTAVEDSLLLPEQLKNDEDVKSWMVDLLEIFQSEVPTIVKLFDSILDCYYLFLRGRHHTAVLTMFDILERYDILDDADEGNFGLFYRCVDFSGWPDGDPHNKETYYHLPFNLRGRIKNQRFSVSGIPVWYGGSSLMCSYFEMRQSILEQQEKLAISVWGFNPLANRKIHNDKRVRERNKIYDITNQLYDAINNTFYDYQKIESPISKKNFFTNHSFIYRTSIRTAIRKFILSNLCTFKSSNDKEPFHQEYILPQILTEAIRLHKYDGILFPSTQFLQHNVSFNGHTHTNFYKSNLAMFTEYEDGENHDIELIENFGLTLISEVKSEDLDNPARLDHLMTFIQNVIKFLDQLKPLTEYRLKEKYLQIFYHFLRQIDVYNYVTIDEKAYFETYVGKVELYSIHDYLSGLYFQIRNTVFQEEFEQFMENYPGLF